VAVYPALETLRRINSCLEKDRGASYRRTLRRTMPEAEDAYREDDGVRSHLGASLMGRECTRELWYSFRWAGSPPLEARLLRLFNRGHLEEARFAALLLAAGFELWQLDQGRKQFKISDHRGHFGGSLDGVVRGIPEYPDEPVLTEDKTHSLKSFTELAGDPKEWRAYVEGTSTRFTGEGVRAAKFEHYVQMQLYMAHYKLKYALYLAVCKDTDDLYAEIIPFDPQVAESFSRRAQDVIFAKKPPSRINENPGWYKCRFCDFRPICQEKGTAYLSRNCRTCVHSTPDVDSKWKCSLYSRILDKKAQLEGCSSHEVIPELVTR